MEHKVGDYRIRSYGSNNNYSLEVYFGDELKEVKVLATRGSAIEKHLRYVNKYKKKN